MKKLRECARCGLVRYEDRMREAAPSEAHPGQTFYVCASRPACNKRRKGRR
jgi:hypothetical protein